MLPTQSARNHLVKMKQPLDRCVDVLKDGKPVPELYDIFRLVKDFNIVLATSHISPEESYRVIEAARDAGVKKIVVTHPEWWLVDMSLDDQVRLARDYDVIHEHCFAQPLGGGKYKSNLPMNLEAIEACGYKNVRFVPMADRWKPMLKMHSHNIYNILSTIIYQKIRSII